MLCCLVAFVAAVIVLFVFVLVLFSFLLLILTCSVNNLIFDFAIPNVYVTELSLYRPHLHKYITVVFAIPFVC